MAEEARLEALRALIRAGGAVPLRPRLLRQIIRHHRDIVTLRLVDAPHADSYVIARDELIELQRQERYLLDTAGLPDPVVLVAEPAPDELQAHDDAALTRTLLRREYHARLHVALAGLEAPDRVLRRLGEAEVREALLVLDQEHRLLPPRTPESEATEILAHALELEAVDPKLLPIWFPSLSRGRLQDVLRRLRLDLDATTLLGPERAAHLRAPETARLEPTDTQVPILDDAEALAAETREAKRLGNTVRALGARRRALAGVPPGPAAEALRQANREDVARLAKSLCAALVEGPPESAWAVEIEALLEEHGSGTWTHGMRLLYDLQKACLSVEHPGYRLRLVSWMRRRAPLRQVLHDQVPVRVHRFIGGARKRAARMHGCEGLEALLVDAEACAAQRLREELRPILRETLEGVALDPDTLPERVAFAKIIEELLDHLVHRGYFSFTDLRDQLSTSDLKLRDLGSLRRLFAGDALLSADAAFTRRLPGVYRRGPIYMRVLQRLSSLAFGNRVGRAVTRYLALPFGGAFVALEGLRHLLGLLGRKPPMPWYAVLATGLVVLAFIESARLRQGGLALASGLWSGLRAFFIEGPARLLRTPQVRALLDSPAWHLVKRVLLKPALPAAALFWVMGHAPIEPAQRDYISLAVFVFLVLFANSRIGKEIEARWADAAAATWGRVRHRLLPNLFGWIMETSRKARAWLEGVAYAVDEALRFREGDARVAFLVKLVGGSVWGIFMYVVQLYTTLLIEPQINPIKHFPVVTVSHKLILPASAQIHAVFKVPLEPVLGTFLGNTIAGATVFLLPGLFGFLVWELSANWRLYEASRPKALRPARIGHHGETMVGLLRPGFHSGTVPKLYGRMRHLEDRRKPRLALEGVEADLQRFVQRELVALLNSHPGFRARVSAGTVRLGLARARLYLRGPGDPLVLTFEEHEQRLSCTVDEGFAAHLEPSEAAILKLAIEGLLARADVDDAKVEWADWVGRLS